MVAESFRYKELTREIINAMTIRTLISFDALSIEVIFTKTNIAEWSVIIFFFYKSFPHAEKKQKKSRFLCVLKYVLLCIYMLLSCLNMLKYRYDNIITETHLW